MPKDALQIEELPEDFYKVTMPKLYRPEALPHCMPGWDFRLPAGF
jgi:hypothetical protein